MSKFQFLQNLDSRVFAVVTHETIQRINLIPKSASSNYDFDL